MKTITINELTDATERVKKCLPDLEESIRCVHRETGRLHSLLQYAVWEEDLLAVKPLVFNGTFQELMHYLTPLLDSHKLKVEGKVNISALSCVVDLLFKIPRSDGKGYMKGESLLYEMEKYIREKDLNNKA